MTASAAEVNVDKLTPAEMIVYFRTLEYIDISVPAFGGGSHEDQAKPLEI